MRNISDKSCRDNKTQFFKKLRRLGNNVQKYFGVKQATVTQHGACVFNIGKLSLQTTHSKYVTHFFSTAAMAGIPEVGGYGLRSIVFSFC